MRPACPLLLAASLLASCEGLVEPVAASTSPADDTAEVGQRLSATAALDATLKVPRCAGSASGCSAGTLLNGRAGLGPEVNTPNTLGGACRDGTAGAYHSDESLDGVSVSVLDGSDFGPGKQVRIDATVWAYAAYSSDKLDLYYASSAAAPAWQLVGTLTPTRAGAQVLSATFALAAQGGTHVVRAQFRYGGAASPCTSGSYNEADDLAFDVGPSSADAGSPPPDAGSPPLSALVVNGDFEAGATGWSLGSAAVTTFASRSGSRSVELWSGSYPVVSQSGTTASSGTSTVSAWVRASGAAQGTFGSSTLTLEVVRGGLTVTSCSLTNPSTSWTQLACAFTADGQPATVRLRATASSGWSAQYYLDDVALTTAASGVQNPGFEAGTAPWQLYSGAARYSGSGAHAGGAYALLPPTSGYGANVYQPQVTIPAGATKLSVWLSTRFTGSGQYATVMVGGVGCSFSSSSTSGAHSPSTYVKRSCSLGGQTGAVDVRVRFGIPSTLPVPAGASVAVDDFAFE